MSLRLAKARLAKRDSLSITGMLDQLRHSLGGTTMTLPITAITALICAILLLLTAIDTVRQRMRAKIAFGDGGDAKIISASRSHANLAEHAPIVIIMIGLLEQAHAHHLILSAVAGFFLLGRVAHVFGLYAPMKNTPPVPRQIGVIFTWVTLLILILWTLWLVVTVNG